MIFDAAESNGSSGSSHGSTTSTTSDVVTEVVSDHARRGLIHAKRVWETVDLTGYDAVSDETRGVLLQISRGMAVIMLIM